MPVCKDCGKDLGFWRSANGRCIECENEIENRRVLQADEAALMKARPLSDAAKAVTLTTETHVGPVERLGIVASEVVLGMHLFKDIAAAFRDTFGGRSKGVQRTLGDARTMALDDIREQAAELGATAVVAISIDYHSIQTSNVTNMFLVAISGTAVDGMGVD